MTKARIVSALLVGAALGLGGCAGSTASVARSPLEALREDGQRATDGEAVARWMLAELLLPHGSRDAVAKARTRLDKLGAKGLYATTARAIDDDAHGQMRAALGGYLDVLEAARGSSSVDSELVGWFAANRLHVSWQGDEAIDARAKEVVRSLLDDPGHIGWRARGQLASWWSVYGDPTGARNANAAERYGCLEHVRIAGPFGTGVAADTRRHYAAEEPGPWPGRFERDPRRLDEPRIVRTERVGCKVRAAEATQDGVYYAETFIDLPAAREVILSAQGAVAIFVDDDEVLTRDTRVWGVWQRFGARLRLSAGRHRILARLASPDTSLTLLDARGAPLGVASSTDAFPPYASSAPERLSDPNVLEPFMRSLGLAAQPGTPAAKPALDVDDPIARFMAAYLAHAEGMDDAAGVLIEPLVRDAAKATGYALTMQAEFLGEDPIYAPNVARDLAKDLRSRAVKKDPGLWWPRTWLLLERAEREGAASFAPELAKLADEFPEALDILNATVMLYDKLGWKVEHAATVRKAAERFPRNVPALTRQLAVEDTQGNIELADRLAARIGQLDPDNTATLQRALDRRDYDAALAELRRIEQVSGEHADVARRVALLLSRAGRSRESLATLEHAVESAPTDASARLALADARYASGDGTALRRAIVDAIETGSDPSSLREASELVEGMNELSPYRVDGRRVIADFERDKPEAQGTAARVLDYSAMWVSSDGSARMLEHEIIAIQSREAIQAMAEQRVPSGLILHLRVIKKDGTTREPEIVGGKPTVTMPHLEIGDYIETESVANLRGDGQGGRRFDGPRWFFREAKLAYYRSEFIVVSPKSRPLDIETTGQVTPPVVSEDGALVTHHWRMDNTPAVPEEPSSAPVEEYLPSVRIGWGIRQDETLERMARVVEQEIPADPRLLRVAESIVRGKDKPNAKVGSDEKARRIYRWVLSNVDAGKETDGRRIVMGKSGVRPAAFVYLCKLAGVEVGFGLVRDRLDPEPKGPMSEASIFSSMALRVSTDHGARWMTVGDKFAPYGYLPSALRGQPVVVLDAKLTRETTTDSGPEDRITHEGTARLSADGSATMELSQRYEGKYAVQLRTGLEQVPAARLNDIVESKLLEPQLPGVRLLDLKIDEAQNLDEPLTLRMKVEVPDLARVQGGRLVVSPPFQLALGRLASLTSRETPLYISEQSATTTVTRLRLVLPEGSRLLTPVAPSELEDGDRRVSLADSVKSDGVVLDRTILLPPGRIQPSDYPAFQVFAQRADEALHRDVMIELPASAAPAPRVPTPSKPATVPPGPVSRNGG